MVMMVAPGRGAGLRGRSLRCLILEGLLQRGKILLRSRNISGLQILPQLGKGLGNGIAALRRRSGAALRLRPQLLQSHKVGLGSRYFARLQIAAELLELLLKLLDFGLNRLTAGGEQVAGDS
jgi:hypothetical protein